MNRLDRRLAKLEQPSRHDDTPITFEIVFVSTEGKPVERFLLTEGGLVPVTGETDEAPLSNALARAH